MKRTIGIFPILSLLAVLVGCQSREAPVPAAASDSTFLFVATPTSFDSLAVVVTAPPEHPIYIVHCNDDIGWRLETRRDGAWQEIWDGQTNACLSPPYRVAPRDTMLFALAPTFEPLRPLPEGEYRVVLHAMYTHLEADTLHPTIQVPLEQRYSNAFRLVERPN